MKSNPIVIIEDDEEDFEIISQVFGELMIQNEIKYFTNGYDALDYLKNTTDKPFLILSDVNMPLLNGLDLKKIIFKDEVLRSKSIPFVFFSTASRSADIVAAYEMMVQGYFVKANDMEALKKLLRVIIDYWSFCAHPNSIE